MAGKWLLAVVCFLFGTLMFVIAPRDAGIPWFHYGFGAFCLSFAAALVTSGRLQAFLGSVVAGVVMCVGMLYLESAVQSYVAHKPERALDDVFGAIFFNLVFGALAARALWVLRFGLGAGRAERMKELFEWQDKTPRDGL